MNASPEREEKKKDEEEQEDGEEEEEAREEKRWMSFRSRREAGGKARGVAGTDEKRRQGCDLTKRSDANAV